MKAIRKSDGQEIEVIVWQQMEYADAHRDEEGFRRAYLPEELIINEDVDWSAFRREAAKDITAAMISNPARYSGISYEDIARQAVICANNLIRQLKYSTIEP